MSQQYERIMVAIDGSYESELAFIKGFRKFRLSADECRICADKYE